MEKLRTESEASALLEEIKQRIRDFGLLFMNGRSHNAQTLANLEISPIIQRQIIDNLCSSDFAGGPGEDHKYAWKYITVFGKDYKGVELYIKFSVGENGTAVVCLSFHQAERPIRYQFK